MPYIETESDNNLTPLYYIYIGTTGAKLALLFIGERDFMKKMQ